MNNYKTVEKLVSGSKVLERTFDGKYSMYWLNNTEITKENYLYLKQEILWTSPK